jgi:uncharacterized protein
MATSASDRILTLDVIRGIAVMGILSVNIVGMAMIESAYFYPPDFGFHSVGDKVMWALNSVFVDGRFRSLFSILFGASTLLVIDRGIAAGKKAWQVHYPRMIVLLLFGLAHFYLLWWGDILANYALVGMVAFLFWRLPTKGLFIAALAVLLFVYGRQAAGFIPQIQLVERVQAGGGTPAEQEKVHKMLAPDPDLARNIAEDKAAHASISAHVAASTKGETLWEPFSSVLGYGVETLGLMLLGMAAFKSGFLTGAWSRRSYTIVAAACIVPDLAIHAYAVIASLKANFAPLTFYPWTQFYVNPFHPIGALGDAALIMLLFSRRSALADRFAAVGRAAFTNYLGSTIVGTLLFFGTFGGLYAQLSRGQVWLFVPFMWVTMLLWSKWWLDRYNYGPFEWVWRTLSRGKPQPMRKLLPDPMLAEA